MMAAGIGTLAGGLAGTAVKALPRLGGLIRTLPGKGLITAGRAAAGGLIKKYPRSASALAQLGLVAAGSYVLDQAGNIVGRRAPARRINPLNVKAARRAARRIKSAMKVCRTLESCLPKRRAPAACAPAFTRARGRRKC